MGLYSNKKMQRKMLAVTVAIVDKRKSYQRAACPSYRFLSLSRSDHPAVAPNTMLLVIVLPAGLYIPLGDTNHTYRDISCHTSKDRRSVDMPTTYGVLHHCPGGEGNCAAVSGFCKTHQVYCTHPKHRYFYHLISEECKLCNNIRAVSSHSPGDVMISLTKVLGHGKESQRI